jgi:hypothetical protein
LRRAHAGVSEILHDLRSAGRLTDSGNDEYGGQNEAGDSGGVKNGLPFNPRRLRTIISNRSCGHSVRLRRSSRQAGGSQGVGGYGPIGRSAGALPARLRTQPQPRISRSPIEKCATLPML